MRKPNRLFIYKIVFFFIFCTPTQLFASKCSFVTIAEDTASESDSFVLTRGQCKPITLRGTLQHETVTLTLDETNGSGFSFNDENGPKTVEFSGKTTTVSICASSSSCGSIAIIQQQSSGRREIGSIRSDIGTWRYVDNSCAIKGPYTHISSPYYILESGRHQIKQSFNNPYMTSSGGPNIPPCAEVNCESKCNHISCDTEVGCTDCIQVDSFYGLPGEFPCYRDSYTVRCMCTDELQYNIFACQ